MPELLAGKTALILGVANKWSLAYAIAQAFHREGAKLLLTYQGDRQKETVGELGSALNAAAIFECDVTVRSQVEALAEYAWKTFGRADVILNNAGVGPIPSSVIDTRPEDVASVLAVNLYGVLNGTSVFGRRFLDQGSPAAIFNVGSENAFFNAIPEGAGYVASKHAVLAMTVALREEVPDHIDVALICPGLVRSELARETEEGMDTDIYAERVMEQLLAGEFYIVSHAFNFVRMSARWQEIQKAFLRYAPRYDGDDEFDVRTIGAREGWYPGYTDANPNLPV